MADFFALVSANMMLTKDLNTLKLADFGMSKKMSQEERTQVWVFLVQWNYSLFSLLATTVKPIVNLPSTDGA
jgi:hypothetical protein